MAERKAATRRATDGEPNTVRLGPKDRVVGQLYVEGDLHLGGSVEGEIVATGDVEIEDTGRAKASVAGREVNVRGQVRGPVTARGRLLVARSGSVLGDVRVERLAIQDGATFTGQVSMGKAAATTEPAPVKAAPRPPKARAPRPAKRARKSPPRR